MQTISVNYSTCSMYVSAKMLSMYVMNIVLHDLLNKMNFNFKCAYSHSV